MSNQTSTITEGKTPGSVTLKEATEAYLEHLASGGGTKPTTITVYKKALGLAIAHFGAERKLDSILVAHTGKYFASSLLNILPSGKPKAQPTIKQNKRVFRQMMEFAQTKGWVLTLPIPKGELKHARSSKAMVTVIPQAEVETPESVEEDAPVETEIQS
jgi:site-specific recombinase XerD